MDRVSTSALLIEEVRRWNEQWMESHVNLDFAFLHRHLSDEYVSTFPDGMVLDKKGEIERNANIRDLLRTELLSALRR
jgi:hypothetical protein